MMMVVALLTWLRKVLLVVTALVAVLMFVPGIPPNGLVFERQEFPPEAMDDRAPSPIPGRDRGHSDLSEVEYLSDSIDASTLGFLEGAESFAVKDGYLYSGVIGGEIIRLDLNKDPVKAQQWQKVAKIGQECKGIHDEAKCGRPLGLTFDRWGFLIVCDAYYGLHRVDVRSGRVAALVPSTVEIDGKRNLITNSVTATEEDGGNVFYYTVSSTALNLAESAPELLSKGSGRMYRYDMAANTSKVILDGYSFLNGIAASPGGDYLLVCECGSRRILKHFLKGPKAGQTDILMYVPGNPDNIKPSGRGTYVVGIMSVGRNSDFSAAKFFKENPLVTKAISRFTHLLMLAFKNLEGLTGNQVFAHLYDSLTLSSINKLFTSEPRGYVMEIDGEGKVLETWLSRDSKVSQISEGFVYKDHMYLGSPYKDFVARIKMN